MPGIARPSRIPAILIGAKGLTHLPTGQCQGRCVVHYKAHQAHL